MFKKFFLALFPLAFWFNSLSARVDQNNDFQVWLYETTSIKVQKKTLFHLAEEIRFGDMASRAFLIYVEPRLEFLVSSHFSFGPGYRQSYRLQQELKKWTWDYAPIVDAFFKWEINKWEFINRNRFMYFFREIGDNFWVYRNRLTIYSPWEWGVMKMNPMFYEEVFFRERDGFVEYRLFFGGRLKFTKKVSTEVGYLSRHIKTNERPKWPQQHIFNVRMNVAF